MSDELLTILRLCLLGLCYLFFFRVLRAVWVETREGKKNTPGAKKNIDPKNFLMAGNSLRSDVLPIVAIGGHAVHIPYELTWDYEKVMDGTVPKSGYSVIKSIRDLPSFVSELHG